MKLATALAIASAALASAAQSQSSQLAAAIASGQVGERYDGYMGFAAPPSEQLRRQVLGVNIQRRSLYTQLAAQRAVNAQLVGLTTACTLFSRLPAGEAYMFKDGVWRRRAASDPPPVPDHCR